MSEFLSRHRALIGLALAVAIAAVASRFGSYAIYLASLLMINIIAAIGLNLLTGNSGQISLCHSSFMAIGAYTSALLTAKLPGLRRAPGGARAPRLLLRARGCRLRRL